MKVRLLRRDTVEEFAENHANGRIHFDNWLSAIKYADWQEPQDMLKAIYLVMTQTEWYLTLVEMDEMLSD
ncbi:MAG TPA: hypothetical protein VK766_04065 [Cytophagaceae bacterium]|jgi:mRNA-degrading endonuclease HigB of HigAB toxin-antitoxin module|nr:hypothetical protein [Cytophagaceae bacterium]